jgi:deoxycytidine triphosphate deaminase
VVVLPAVISVSIPKVPALVQPNLVDVRLCNQFVWYKSGKGVLDPCSRKSERADIEETRAETFILDPGQSFLAGTLECIGSPIISLPQSKESPALPGSA